MDLPSLKTPSFPKFSICGGRLAEGSISTTWTLVGGFLPAKPIGFKSSTPPLTVSEDFVALSAAKSLTSVPSESKPIQFYLHRIINLIIFVRFRKRKMLVGFDGLSIILCCKSFNFMDKITINYKKMKLITIKWPQLQGKKLKLSMWLYYF